MQIVPMSVENVPEVHEIEKICFNDPWSISTLEAQLLTDHARYFVAYIDDEVAGYAGMWQFGDEGEIINFAVHPKFRKRGIADSLMDKCKTICKRIYLEVREGNAPARCLYEKHGFAAVGVRKNYYSNPTENAIIMLLEGV